MENITVKPQIEASWLDVLQDEFQQDYFKKIKSFLKNEKSLGKKIYPSSQNIFAAFNHTPFHKVKVVLLGQDPYHGENQAHGLSFSVPKGIAQPPSLQNIFKEMSSDLDIAIPSHGDLTNWAVQGVLLLNAMLTVAAAQPASHSKIGWEQFTNAVIEKISAQHTGIVFLLWGKFAQKKKMLIDLNKHYVLEAAHPSPFSAYNGFFGCRHFSKTNTLLLAQNKTPIQWACL